MQVERIDEMRLREADAALIAALLPAAFAPEDGFGGRPFYQQRPHVRFVVRGEDRIVGHLAIILRAIRMGEALVTVAGVADVATDPAHRGRGIAGALVRAAVAEAESSPARALVLFGDAGVYPAHGFRAVPNTVRYTDSTDTRTGTIVTEVKEGLRVHALDGFVWDDAALIDLVGHAF